jgi:MHS family proline/betaine transporter-like MFS transporter
MSQPQTHTRSVSSSVVHRAVAASAMGNCVEWFDFGVYSYVAVSVGATFFPAESKTAQLLSAFAAFAVSFLVRPLGGMFFGPLGDRIGRQRVLVMTIFLMSGSTVALGVLPGYATIGVAAPILLLCIRMLQGFSTGGEYAGASTFIAEYAPDRRRGFLCSWLEFGTLGGYVMGSGLAATLTATLPPADMNSWGWRIPFLLGGPLGLVGLYLRYKLEDTPVFQELKTGPEFGKVPVRRLLERSLGAMLLCVGIVLAYGVTDYAVLTYMPTFLSGTLGVSSGASLLLTVGVMLMMMAIVVPMGALSDRIGRKPIQLAGALGFLVLSVPALLLIHTRSLPLVAAGILILGMCLVCFLSTFPSTLPALFPSAVRYSGFAISYNVAVSLFGGTTPLAVEYLTSRTGNTYMMGFYIMAAALIGLGPLLLSKESARRPLPGMRRLVDAEPAEARARGLRVKPGLEEPG